MKSSNLFLICLTISLILVVFQGCKKDDNTVDNTDTTTNLLLKWRVTAALETGAPWDVTVDNENNVYVSEREGNKIDKFNASGTLIKQWGTYGTDNGQFNNPKYISTDGSNNLYVSDNMNDRVQKFTSSGTYITQWGGIDWDSKGNGQFIGPCAIAVDKNNNCIYVADQARIQKFDLSGNFITQWGSYGTDDGQFEFYDSTYVSQGPEGDIAVDNTGNVYVVDNMNCRVQKFTSSGEYISKWGSKGSENGKFLYPSGIAIDTNSGSVYISDNSTPYGGGDNIARIEKFDLSGNFLAQLTLTDEQGNQSVGGLAVDNTGNIYAVEGESISKYAF